VLYLYNLHHSYAKHLAERDIQPVAKRTIAAIVTTLGVVGLLAMQPVVAWASGYFTDDAGLKPGMVVALSKDSTPEESKVERASAENPFSIIGIATTPEDQSVTIASEKEEVYVENSGEVTAYVSDVNGEVKKGDRLTISPLKGILSKSPEKSALILGIALEDASSKPAEEYQIQSDGSTKTAKVVSMRINFDRKPGSNQDEDSPLESLGKTLTGKNINEIRVVAAIIIFLIVLIAEASILYGAISSAITSLGRNPLARDIIKHELLRVVIIAFAVLVFGLGSIFLILKV